MKRHHEISTNTKVGVGLAVGGLVAALALSAIYVARSHRTPIIKKIGHTISEVGEMLENCDCNWGGIEDHLPKSSAALSRTVDWISTGIKFLNSFRK